MSRGGKPHISVKTFQKLHSSRLLTLKPFGVLSLSNVDVSVRRLFTETKMMLATLTPNNFDLTPNTFAIQPSLSLSKCYISENGLKFKCDIKKSPTQLWGMYYIVFCRKVSAGKATYNRFP